MRLTKQTNYAVRILMYCAANSGTLSRIPEIATAYDLSESFLFKILKPIADNGFVDSVRGRNGGIRLAKPADEISLLDIVRITEDNFAMADCFNNGITNCPLVDACKLNSVWNEALSAFFAVLEQYTIADLIRPSPNINMLLGIDALNELSAR
jgi:Rrf2 family iron-responsive transcriptional regulator